MSNTKRIIIYIFAMACSTSAFAKCDYVDAPPGIFKRQVCEENGKRISETNYGKNYIRLSDIKYYDDGKVKSERVLDNNGKLKYEKQYNKHGVLIKHRVENGGKMHGRQIGTYTGDRLRPAFSYDNYVNGVREGEQKNLFPNGKPYRVSHYKNGKMHGNKTEYFENGKLKELSQWKDGEKHGKETTYHENGHKREIETFENGLRHGLNVIYHKNGKEKSRVCYQKNKRVNGLALCSPKGSKKSGKDIVRTYFENGKIKTKYSAKNGEYDGKYFRMHKNGTTAMVTTYKMGKKHGRYFSQKDDKTERVFKNYKNDRLDGKETHYFEGKKVKQIIVWSNGVKKRDTSFYMNGQKKEKAEYGDLVSITKWNDDGQLIQKGTFKELTRYRYTYLQEHGMQETYDDGKLSFRGEYADGKRIGKHVYFHDNEKPYIELVYKDDRKTASKEWNKVGKLVESVEFYSDGSKKTLSH